MKVYVQAGTPFRMLPDNINQWYVRNASGTMAPLSAYSSTEWTYGSPRLERYNGIPSMEILGEAAAGKSTGDAMKFMADLVAKLPAGAPATMDRTVVSGSVILKPGLHCMPFHWSWCSSPSPHSMRAGQFRSR
ncbi:efflux RND transporter permease subunit [Escherichia coli]